MKTLLAVLAITSPASADQHPSCVQAHRAAFITMSYYAQSLDGHLQVGPCAKRGTATTITRIRVVGGVRPERFRLWITLEPNETYTVRARPAEPNNAAYKSTGR